MCGEYFEGRLLLESHLFDLGGWQWAWPEEEGLKIFLGDEESAALQVGLAPRFLSGTFGWMVMPFAETRSTGG